MKENGFDINLKGNLSTRLLAGLYTRVSYTGNLDFIGRICLYQRRALFALTKILPSDIIYVVLKRT
jgi:hypothetical protein